MPPDDGTEPVADDELLYRRIPVSMGWYSGGTVSPEAFDPRPDETTGISVFRAKYKSIADAGIGKSKKGYYVAVLCASELRQNEIEIEPRPLEGEPGHAELPGLTCENRLTTESLERKQCLSKLVLRVEGPFVQIPDSQADAS
jgi:hypothetical protein